MKKLIIAWIFFCVAFIAKGQVDSIEYFFDIDPGKGNGLNAGNPTLIEDTNNKIFEQLTFNASITALSDGFHKLYIRAKSAYGWSQTQVYPFVKMNLAGETILDIQYVEYFIDNDPGYGKGTEISSNAGNEAYSFDIDVSTMEDGFHILNVRAMNKYNHWSQLMSRPFIKTILPSDLASGLTEVEYYLDTDPGTGNGISIPVSLDATQLDFTVDLTNVSLGGHILYLRGKNRIGHWEDIEEHHFIVIDEGSNTNDFSNKEIVIAPNPVKSILHFQSLYTIEQITIYDISGRMLLSNPNLQSFQNLEGLNIDISHLASGIYLVKIKTTEGETLKKIVKE